MRTSLLAWLLVVSLCAACNTGRPHRPPESSAALLSPHDAVWETELAFARTMAERDHDAFVSFLDEEAVFFSPSGPLRGRDAVAAAWKDYLLEPVAPFSWEPDSVEVLASGLLALSTGPVRASDGSLVGHFNSIWRWNGEAWRIVFDKGDD